MKLTDISIAIPTYNRSEVLKLCLNSLVEQNYDRKRYEILVIDNNSTDGTTKLLERFCKDYKNIRHIFEKRQGVSYCRNTGWKSAKYDIVAYIDDDGRAEKNWLEEISRFAFKHPEAEIFGGPWNPYYLDKKPDWFPDDYGKLNLGNRVFRMHSGGDWITGTNMVFRRKALERLGGFSEFFGMRGEQIMYGEEPDILERADKEAMKIYYVPSIKVEHLVAKYKFSLRWLLKSKYMEGLTYYGYGVENTSIKVLTVFFRSLVYGIYLFIFSSYWPIKNRIYNSFKFLFTDYGTAVSYFSKHNK